MGIVKPTKFQIKISSCGMDCLNSSYNRIESKNPLILGKRVVNLISRDFTIGKENMASYQYRLACFILKELKFDKKNLFKDIENIEEFIKKVELKEEKIINKG